MAFQRILITGGCGFIGANLLEFLLRNGHSRIRIFDNLSLGKREYIQAVVDAFNSAEGIATVRFETHGDDRLSSSTIPPHVFDFPHHKIQLMIGDIRNKRQVSLACRNVDTVVHLAAHTSVVESLANPEETVETNTMGNRNLLEGSRECGIERIVFASSNAAAGEQFPPVNERLISGPSSPYGASKVAGEAMCAAYFHAFGLKAVSLRFANVYGHYSYHKTSVIAEFCRRLKAGKPLIIYGDGTQTRDFIHTYDVCKAIYLTLKALDRDLPAGSGQTPRRPSVAGEIFQIATGHETSILDLSRRMLGLFKESGICPDPSIVFRGERVGEIHRNRLDITKAKKRLGFHPEVDLQKGLESLFSDEKKLV